MVVALPQRDQLADDAAHHFLARLELARPAAAGHLQDLPLRLIEHIVQRAAGIKALLGDLLRRLDQPAQVIAFLDDIDVIDAVGAGDRAVTQLDDIVRPAGQRKLFRIIEPGDQRRDIDVLPELAQIHHAAIDAAMHIEVELIRLQILIHRDVHHGRIDQHGAENRLFRLGAVRQLSCHVSSLPFISCSLR